MCNGALGRIRDGFVGCIKPCPFIRSGGTVGAFTDEGFVGRLFKPVCSEMVRQIQTVRFFCNLVEEDMF